MSVELLKNAIRDVPDFPKPGIVFKDITPILHDPQLFRLSVDLFAERHTGQHIDKIAVIDARGFIFGSALAYTLGVGLVPIRKPGKLPYKVIEESYELEYGTNTLAVHVDAFEENDSVVIVDDLLATGGTAEAAVALVQRLGANVCELDVLVELSFLNGREKLEGINVYSPIVF
jgi:adenine phosphoribosyltransferase